MQLNEYRARLIVDLAHSAWSRGDLDGVLAHYVDDLVYSSNTYGPNGSPLLIHGKAGLRAMLEPIAMSAECVSVPEYFKFADGVAKVRVQYYMHHRSTRHVLVGSFRQIVRFRGNKISHLEEFHDAARMTTFWNMTSHNAEIEKVLLGAGAQPSETEVAGAH
jgi:ketosteroid isomerase-like protein